MFTNLLAKKTVKTYDTIYAVPVQPPHTELIALQFRNVSVKDNSGSVWLPPTSGYFVYNGLNAVMGGSGCGKSTLMDVLRGRMYSGIVEGEAEAPLHNLTLDDMKSYRLLFGFVPQDDVLYGNLTVKENVQLSAILKSKHPRDCQATLEALGLDATIQNRLVGTVSSRGISGGQRKRTSIAMELVTGRPILIFDEPTSGLDSTGSYQVLKALKEVPDTTIIAILHQPRFNSFMLFDHMLLLSKSGPIFMGSPRASILYFQYALKSNLNPDDNPADAIMDIVNKNHNDLALTWSRYGVIWMTKALDTFPNLNHMTPLLTNNVKQAVYNTDIVDVFVNNNITLTLKDIEYIRSIDVPSYIQRITPPDTITSQVEFFKHTTLEPITLSKHVISFEVYPLVRKFCNIMLKRYKSTRDEVENRLTSQKVKQKFFMLFMVLNGMNYERPLHNPNIFCPDLPSRIKQYLVVLWTSMKSQYRSMFIIQIIVTLSAGFIIGGIQGSRWSPLEFPSKISMAITCLTMLSVIKHVDTFSNDALIIRRNVYNNASITSYTCALMTVDLIWIVGMPLLFLVPYYYLIFPTVPFGVVYGYMLMACMWASGLSYLITQINSVPLYSNLVCVFIVIILGVFFNGLMLENKGIVTFFHGLSYNRWTTEALSIYEFSYWEHSMNNNIYSFMQRVGFCSKSINNTSESLILSVLRSVTHHNKYIMSACRYVITDSCLVLIGTSLAFRLAAYALFQLRYKN